MVMNGVMTETICRVLFFPESYATSQSACSEGLLGTLATSKTITAKNVTFKKSLRFSNFFYRDYFNSLKTSNICKFSGIEFLRQNPKLRRRKKNLSWGGYVLHKTELPVREFHVTKCATSRAKFFFFCQSLVAVAVIVEKAP